MANITKTYAKRDNVVVLNATTGAATQTIACDTPDERTAIIIENTSASESANVTVVAGNGMRSSIGDLEIVVAPLSEAVVGPLDSMRFKNLNDGTVTVKISGGSTKVKPFSL